MYYKTHYNIKVISLQLIKINEKEKARENQKKFWNFCFIDNAKPFACVDHSKLENSSRDENTRLPYLSPMKPVYRSISNG